MEVFFSAPTKLGNRAYKAGKQVVPDSLAHNIAFKKMVAAGQISVVPRDGSKQMTQMAHDARAHAKARAARAATKASKSAMAALSAHPTSLDAAGSVQALPTPAKPILAGAAAPASAPAAPATAPLAKRGKM